MVRFLLCPSVMKNTKKATKKLRLTTESIRDLTKKQMVGVNGGGSSITCPPSGLLFCWNSSL